MEGSKKTPLKGHLVINLPPEAERRFWAKVVKGAADSCWTWNGRHSPAGYGVFSMQGKHYQAHRVAVTLSSSDPGDNDVDHLCRNHACVNPAHLEAVTHQENVRRGTGIASKIHDTHCKNGHEYTPANTETVRGHRRCRICHRAAQARGRERYRLTEKGRARDARAEAVRRQRREQAFKQRHPDTTETPAQLAARTRSSTRLTLAAANEIRVRYAQGGVTRAALGLEFGVSPRTIEAIVSGKRWKA